MADKNVDNIVKNLTDEENSSYEALKKLNKKVGDFLVSKTGRKYRIDEPSDSEGLKIWGKDHVLLRELNDKDEDVFDYGSYGWFPIGFFAENKGE